MKRLTAFALLCLLGTLAFGQAPDPTKIPHYFGPYPNWANSPLTTVDAHIQFTDGCGGNGAGATAVASVDRNGAITAITITNQGTGYTCAPLVNITSTYGSGALAHATLTPAAGYISAITLVNAGSNYFSPVVTITGDGTGATADATSDPYTGAITGITLTNPGSGYTTATVAISDWGGLGSGASATAALSGAVIAAVVDSPGSGYKTPGGLRKFVDTLPGLGPAAANNLGQYISLAHPDTITYPGSDYYEIAVVQYSKQLHSDLPLTKLRGYVQLNNGTDASGQNSIPPDPVQYLGAMIVAEKDRPVRILFKNQLPTGVGGNLFLPVDTTLMGAGMGPDMGGMTETDNNSVNDGVRNPMCGMPGAKPMGCFVENRATIHLHGGNTPWISDGTPHQWITPAGETTSYPKGVSAKNVPDMWFDASGNTVAACAGQSACAVPGSTNDPGAGAMTYYYTNQQSARLLFYHDHSWGITRLNVYAGEAAGYLITDPTEQALIAPGAPLADVGYGIPLIIQDKTFVPGTAQLAVQDPTWDATRWGGTGGLWYHHVYMTAQNPADPTGVNPYGRWMYGPWFWPPAGPDTTPYQPIPNPYYVAGCDPATAPNGFCEPPLIPGTPNISVGMEQFNDTPLVNGAAYPTVTLEPKAYRFRILSAANDRFFNLQWYVADSTGTEVALKAAEVAAAQIDPTVFPTPDTTLSPKGPSWIQIGTEGGFLPMPAIVSNQPITWITDPTRFDFGNVDKHSLLLAAAERADVIVDFSPFAGKTLILYNDAPAAFPARQGGYDYYTGHPDMSDIGGAPPTIPGFGPNTRTLMQVKVAGTPASPFNLAALVAAFQHTSAGTGVFESGQNPIIVGQAGYNRAYGASFTNNGFCSAPTSTIPCDGFARIQQQGGDPFTFDTLNAGKLSLTLRPKTLHDEMNATTFDAYGRMQANLGVEAVPASAAAQTTILYPFVNPSTELIDATALPSGASLKVTPIGSATDGTQIWKITHNGVDTHPIHFHLFDVQLINRVTWDNIILPPDANELGWKDTIRVSPLEDTLVAIRPVVPAVPFPLPNSYRPLNPMMPLGSTMGFNSVDATGNPTAAITNDIVNFGWEYMWHCHILSHEEMDMMRPMLLAVPPAAPSLLASRSFSPDVTLTWADNSLTATNFTVQRATDKDFTTGLVSFPLGYVATYTDTTAAAGTPYFYRVYASDTVGSTQSSGYTASPGGNAFPTLTVNSDFSNVAAVDVWLQVPAAMTSPAPGSRLSGSTVTFTWNTGTHVTGYWLWVGTAPGALNLYDASQGSNTSVTLTNLPTNGITLYVRLFSLFSGGMKFNDYTYQAFQMSPANGSTLPGSSATFSWSAIPGAASYWMWIGSAPGGLNLYDANLGSNTSVTVNGLPTNGQSLYVRLFYWINGGFLYNDFTYKAFTPPAAPAVMISPTPGSTLSGSSATFTWSAGTGVSKYWLWIGTSPGALNLYDASQGTNTSVTVNGLPTNGSTIYVRLFSLINGALQYNDYTYKAFDPPPALASMIAPVNGTTLSGSSVTFTWTTGNKVTSYWLWIGTSPGALNLYDANQGTNTSVTVNGLPTNGSTIYVRLFSLINGALQHNDYTYVTGP